MREVEFRAWSKIYLRYIDVDMVASFTHIDNGKLNISPNCIFEQYTGLKDKNGVKVFEGDILSLNGDIHSVGFQSGCFLLIEETIFNAEIEPLYKYYFEEYEGTDLVIVGNIHENSELLKA